MMANVFMWKGRCCPCRFPSHRFMLCLHDGSVFSKASRDPDGWLKHQLSTVLYAAVVDVEYGRGHFVLLLSFFYCTVVNQRKRRELRSCLKVDLLVIHKLVKVVLGIRVPRIKLGICRFRRVC